MNEAVEKRYKRQLEMPVALDEHNLPISLSQYLYLLGKKSHLIQEFENRSIDESYRIKLAIERIEMCPDFSIAYLGVANQIQAINQIEEETELGKALCFIEMNTIEYAILFAHQKEREKAMLRD